MPILRHAGFDTLKGVCLYSCSSDTLQFPWCFWSPVNAFVRFAVPVFFCISGYWLHASGRSPRFASKSTPAMLSYTVRSLTVPNASLLLAMTFLTDWPRMMQGESTAFMRASASVSGCMPVLESRRRLSRFACAPSAT